MLNQILNSRYINRKLLIALLRRLFGSEYKVEVAYKYELLRSSLINAQLMNDVYHLKIPRLLTSVCGLSLSHSWPFMDGWPLAGWSSWSRGLKPNWVVTRGGPLPTSIWLLSGIIHDLSSPWMLHRVNHLQYLSKEKKTSRTGNGLFPDFKQRSSSLPTLVKLQIGLLRAAQRYWVLYQDRKITPGSGSSVSTAIWSTDLGTYLGTSTSIVPHSSLYWPDRLAPIFPCQRIFW